MPLADEEKWSRASFRVWSDDIPPESIADALGLAPTQTFRRGAPVSKRSAAVRKEHGIRIESPLPKSEPLERHLAHLCDVMEPRTANIAALAGRCEYDIFCGFSSGNGQGGFTLSSHLLRRLAALQIELVVELYPPSPDVLKR